MPYKPSHVANSFLYRARNDGVSDITPLKIQKLTYFLHGWFLATRGEGAVGELFEAWPYGPVLPSLYQEFKGYGANPIQGYAVDIDPISGENKSLMVPQNLRQFYDVFDRVWAKYKPFSGTHLSALTHAPGSPWSIARDRGSAYITNEQIRSNFIELAQNELQPALNV